MGSRFDLTVPFKEKEVVKQLGAKWDGNSKVWYYYGDYRFAQKSLMKWDPRVYLNVPFHEKDEAKDEYDCKWDPQRKQWYLQACFMSHLTHWRGLARWIPPSAELYSTPSRPSAAAATPPSTTARISSARAGSAKEATMLRINDYMTVKQLQDECRFRGTVKGYSNQSKAWLLEQLVVGSVWQSAPSMVGTPTTPNKKRNSQPKKEMASTNNKRLKSQADYQSGGHYSSYSYEQVRYYGYHREEMYHQYDDEEEDGYY